MYKSIKTKLKLNNKQKTFLAQHAGYSRWVYNWGLSLWNAAYKDGYKPNARKLREVFTNHTKPLYPWMKNLSSKVYQYAHQETWVKHLKGFFKGWVNVHGLRRKADQILSQLIIVESQWN
ncbi:MAG: helix-turn-helix domain-containing protein [Trichodesmium sp. MO_231.B1]|nr:helix-turn-helix domain-containing protein [Okeania sp. SIO2F4]MDJ0516061.1 helix-turn-helix domain-containing protein [Trichodesmium sp. MO_231.B1]